MNAIFTNAAENCFLLDEGEDVQIEAIRRAFLRYPKERTLIPAYSYMADPSQKISFLDPEDERRDNINRARLLSVLEKAGIPPEDGLISNAEIYSRKMVGDDHNPAGNQLIEIIEKHQDEFTKEWGGNKVVLELGPAAGEVTRRIFNLIGHVRAYYGIELVPSFREKAETSLKAIGVNVEKIFGVDFTDLSALKKCFAEIHAKYPDAAIEVWIFGNTEGNFSERTLHGKPIGGLLSNLVECLRVAPKKGRISKDVGHPQRLDTLRQRYLHASTDYFLLSALYDHCRWAKISGLDLTGFESQTEIENGIDGPQRFLVCTREQTWKMPVLMEDGKSIEYKDIKFAVGQRIDSGFPSHLRASAKVRDIGRGAAAKIVRRMTISNRPQPNDPHSVIIMEPYVVKPIPMLKM